MWERHTDVLESTVEELVVLLAESKCVVTLNTSFWHIHIAQPTKKKERFPWAPAWPTRMRFGILEQILHQRSTNVSQTFFLLTTGGKLAAENRAGPSTIWIIGWLFVYITSNKIRSLKITSSASNETLTRLGPFWLLWYVSQHAKMSSKNYKVSDFAWSHWARRIKLNNFLADGRKVCSSLSASSWF